MVGKALRKAPSRGQPPAIIVAQVAASGCKHAQSRFELPYQDAIRMAKMDFAHFILRRPGPGRVGGRYYA